MDAVLTCMVSDSIGPGTLSHQLASDLASYLGVEPGVCVRDYVGAIDVALTAVGAVAGDRIAISALAPDVYRTVLEKRGLRPLLLDVDPASGTLLIERVQQAAAEGVRAVIVHYTVGIIPDIEAIVETGVPVIEDVSEGLGGMTAERRIGSYGQYVIVGLEPEHIITCGGGAAVLAGGKRERSELKRVSETLPREVLLSDMNAALGIQQVKRVEQFVQKRREIAAIYNRALLRGRHRMLMQPGDAENVFHSFAVVLAGGAREVIQYSRKKQVECVYAFEKSLFATISEPTRAADNGARAEDGAPDDDAVDPRIDGAAGSAQRSGNSQGGGADPVGTIDTVANGAAGIPDSDAVDRLRAGYPGARALLLRCVLFPLYPVLPKREVDRIEKVVTTLP